jgi:lipopolysaccharide export system protein LptC
VQLTRREIGLAVALLSLGAGAWWLIRAQQSPDTGVVTQGRRPDYVVDGIRGVTMDERGMPAQRIDATRLRHYPDDGSSELDEPVLEVLGEDGPPWRARSESAWINAEGDEVLLQDKVVLSRSATDLAAPIELRTSELLVLPQVDYAETGRFVEIEQGQDWLTGTDGVRAWFGETTRIQVFGRVRARIEPATGEESP